MIVDAIILLIAFALMGAGLWLIWSVAVQAFEDWRTDR